MSKRTLAMDILRKEKNRTAFWFVAFIITISVVIVRHFAESEVR